MSILRECDEIVREYIHWLRGGIVTSQLDNDVCAIETPFLDRYNDHIQIYIARIDGDAYRITDDGYTLNNLSMSGVDINSPKRREILDSITQSFGITVAGDELVAPSTRQELPRKKHNMIQTILSVNDMFYLSRESVASFFREDVERFLIANAVRYTPSLKLPGKSGFDHAFDFVIPASGEAPERLVRTINSPDKNSIQAYIFAWNDARVMRPGEVTAYAVLNDTGTTIPPANTQALRTYDIKPVLWSARNQHLEELKS